MIKKNLKVLIITSIVIVMPIVAGVVLWDKLPNKVPSHWNINNEIDGYMGKPFFVFGMPCIMLALQWFCVLATFLDPKNKNHPTKILHLVFWLIPALNLLLTVITYSTALGQAIKISVVMPLFMGLLFLIIGNYLPKCKQNYTIGIKIPWTLNNKVNWTKTHRFAGWVWVICSIVIIATSFLGSFWILIGATLIMALSPIVYSFVLYKLHK